MFTTYGSLKDAVRVGPFRWDTEVEAVYDRLTQQRKTSPREEFMP
jgi:hypothetical protein